MYCNQAMIPEFYSSVMASLVPAIQLPHWLVNFAEHAELYGLPVVLSLICLLQYTLHLYYRYRTNNRELQLRSNLNHLEGEMSQLQRERYLAKIENSILRDIFANTATGRAVELLLKKFVPHANQGFVVFFCRQETRLEVFLQRGLTVPTAGQIRLDPDWVNRVIEQRVVQISAAELAESRVLELLAPRER